MPLLFIIEDRFVGLKTLVEALTAGIVITMLLLMMQRSKERLDVTFMVVSVFVVSALAVYDTGIVKDRREEK
jgi:hypothetical protein